MPIAHIYLAEGFEEVEMVSVADILRRADIDAKLVSLTENLLVAGAHSIAVQADLPFSQATGLADAIILPTGLSGAVSCGPQAGAAALPYKSALIPDPLSHSSRTTP